MEVFLTVLKIIGIVLASIVGLVLFILMLVLFVPFRYRADVKKEEEADLNAAAKVSWLLSIVQVVYEIEGKQSRPVLILFWFIRIPLKFEKKPEEPKEEEQEEKPPKEKKPFRERFQELKKKIRRILGFAEDERNQNAISFVYGKFIRLLKHVMPKKASGYVDYGLSDPSSTAKVLSIVSATLPLHKNAIDITPEFDREVFSCDAKVKGRIFLIVIGVTMLSVILNRDVRYLIRTAKHNFGNNNDHKGGVEHG